MRIALIGLGRIATDMAGNLRKIAHKLTIGGKLDWLAIGGLAAKNGGKGRSPAEEPKAPVPHQGGSRRSFLEFKNGTDRNR